MTIKATTMNPTDATSSRRHDLDALRAAAMLLGIVFHSSLSVALGFGWMVRDVSQSKTAYLFQAWVHGFRMPLFMVVSGFFTAMLWRKRGLKALFSHRFRRVLLPCLLGLATVEDVLPALRVSTVGSAGFFAPAAYLLSVAVAAITAISGAIYFYEHRDLLRASATAGAR